MAKTTIEYTDEVSNPLFARPIGDETVKIGTFCEKPDAEGTCQKCWAEVLNLRFGNKLKFDKSNRSKIEWIYKDKPMQRLRSLNADKRESERNPGNPLMIFCCDTFDLFQPSISDELRHRVFDEYDKFTNLTLQIQTTYTPKMAHFINNRYGADVPKHYWFGMSAGNQEWLDKNIQHLLSINSSVRYVIFEPLLEEVDPTMCGKHTFNYGGSLGVNILDQKYASINWMIVGGESGAGARQCSVGWIRSLVEKARKNNCPVLVKQYGSFLSKLLGFKSAKGKDMSEWTDDLKVRQFPR